MEAISLDDDSPIVTGPKHSQPKSANMEIEEPETIFLKILVVGEGAVGKTSLIKKYVSGIFSTRYKSTIGVDFAVKSLVRTEYEEKPIGFDHTSNKQKTVTSVKRYEINLQFWDLAGQDRLNHQSKVYYREAKGALCVCDISRKNTRDEVLKWKEAVLQECRDSNGDQTFPPCVLVFNKMDLFSESEPWFEPNKIESEAKTEESLDYDDVNIVNNNNKANRKTPEKKILKVVSNVKWSKSDVDKIIRYALNFVNTKPEGTTDYKFWKDILTTSQDEAMILKLRNWNKNWRAVVLGEKKIEENSKDGGNAKQAGRNGDIETQYAMDDELMQYTNFAQDNGFLVGVLASAKEGIGLDLAIKLLVDNILMRRRTADENSKESGDEGFKLEEDNPEIATQKTATKGYCC